MGTTYVSRLSIYSGAYVHIHGLPNRSRRKMTEPVRTHRKKNRRKLILATALVILAAGVAGLVVSGLLSPRLSGTIEIDGSSTVYPITEAVAEEFRRTNPDVRVNVGISGTGGGFQRFSRGEIDIADASRPIKTTEANLTRANGIDWIELKVALDGLTVVVHPSNTWVNYLTVEELKLIWEPNSQGTGNVTRWNQIRPEWPNEPLVLYGPGTDSGTFDYFTEVIVGKVDSSRSDYTASEDDNVLVQGIANTPNSLGYFGYAYYAANQGRVKVVPIDSGNGPVTPSDETINAGQYTPLSRPLFIYVKTESMARAEVKTFVHFYLAQAEALAREVGYTSLPTADYQNQLSTVKTRFP